MYRTKDAEILILGAGGQLGKQLLLVFNEKKTDLGTIPIFFNRANVTAVDVDLVDITKPQDCYSLIQPGKFDIVFNCAAYTNVDQCERDPERAMLINCIGARNVALACAKADATLVYLSTDYVFSGDQLYSYREWDLCNPQSIYAKSKYWGEKHVLEICKKYFIIRTAWLYGYYGNNFVKTILKRANLGANLRVVNDQIGNPTNASDMVHHVLKLAATKQYGIYHCTGNGKCSWYEFAVKILEYSRTPCKIEPCSTEESGYAARRPQYSDLDNLMLRCTVGDEMRHWEDALKSFLSHYKLYEAQ